MAAKKDSATDMFMNWADISVNLDAADSSVLVEAQRNTGLSIRGALLWLIHVVEIYFPREGASNELQMAVSTRAGLAVMPLLGDTGVVVKAIHAVNLTVEGASQYTQPVQLRYLPPIPIAAPQLSLYAKSAANIVGLRGDLLEARIGFTTAPLDAAAYTEIAEVWGW